MFNLFKPSMHSRRAEKALEISRELAQRWRLDRTFSLPGTGPANLIVDGLNQIFSRLNSFILDLTRRNVQLATVAPLTHRISRQVRESAESLSQQTEQIEHNCLTLAEGINRSTDSANQALRQSASIVSKITRTGGLTHQALQQMETMQAEVAQLTGSIAALDRQSHSIGSIIESISDIADHTGLLSLNAFIEAARAGSHGAGFGVIAHEIRQLSQESARAAQEVKNSLLTISELVGATVTAVAHVKQCVETGTQVNREAAEALTQVSHEHQHFHSHLESVISAINDQKSAMTLFTGDLAQITAIGKEGKSNSGKLADLAERVKTLTEEQLLAGGMFILPQYRTAETAVAAMAADPDICTAGKNTDQALQRQMQPLPYLELVYLTDTKGLQVSSNVLRKERDCSAMVRPGGKTGAGESGSER
jgi:methyl-accepting chemotaxis protein